jgi:pSer/pThr/pTyr-binding forkhead associated (FHA) protein
MQFGHLQIFRPDGMVETVMLNGETVGIGRSPGNYLVLDRDGVSRYHVTLSAKDDDVYIEDLESVNGTYIDGLPLPPHDPRLLRGGEEIQIADVRLVFQPMLDLDVTIKTVTQSVEADGYVIELEGPDIAVTPGAHASARLHISNMTAEPQTFTIFVEGIPADWVRLDHRQLEVPADEKRDIRINFKPRRHPDSKPGEYDMQVKVQADDESATTYTIDNQLHVLKYSGYGVALANPTVKGTEPFQLYVHNQGNAPLSIGFRGESPGNKLQFEIAPPSVILSAGERKTISGRMVTRQRALFGNSREHRFDIISRSRDASSFQAPISGTYVEEPLIPLWGVIGGAVLAILGLLLLGFVALSLFDGDDDSSPTTVPVAAPAVLSYDINAAQTTVTDPVLVTWDTSDAELVSLILMRDEEELATYALPGPQGVNYELPIAAAGRYTLLLEAKNRDLETTDQRTVFVSPALSLDINIPGSAEGSALTLFRNVEQEVEIAWDATWTDDPVNDQRTAPTVVLDCPAFGYDQQNVALSSPPQTITTMPTTDDRIECTLISNGPDDVQNDLVMTILIVQPTCDTVNESTDIYLGPDEQGYPVLYTVPEAQRTLQVNTRTEDSTWVQVLIPDDVPVQQAFGWIPLDQLSEASCSFEDVDDLLIADVIPTRQPPPQDTPRPTITPSPVAEDVSGG